MDVDNFECRFYNWEVLECTWTTPYNPAQTPSDNYLPYLCVFQDCTFDQYM